MPPDRKITVLDQQGLKLLLLSVNGRAIGSCQIAGWSEDEPSILGINIDPNHRRKGHATVLVREVIEMAQRDRRTALTLTVERENIEAINLYRRLGFVTDLEDPIQLWMSVRLTINSDVESELA